MGPSHPAQNLGYEYELSHSGSDKLSDFFGIDTKCFEYERMFSIFFAPTGAQGVNLCVFLSGTKNIKEHDERIREHLQGRLQHARIEHLEGEAMPCRGM